MKYYSCFALAFICASSLFALRPKYSHAQPPDPLPQLQAQTKDGLTVRFKQAYWSTPEDNAGKGLAVEFEDETATTPHSGPRAEFPIQY